MSFYKEEMKGLLNLIEKEKKMSKKKRKEKT